MSAQLILVLYPESESTKVAIYKNASLIFLKIIKHKAEDLGRFNHVLDQQEYRKEILLRELEENEIPLDEIRIIMARGGLVKPVQSGIYEVNEAMKEDLRKGVMGTHATNLGGLLADDIASLLPNAQAYIADPVVVDELSDVARITGHPLFQRKSVFHALNQKFVAREYAKSINKKYEDLRLIVSYIGMGGVSVGAHKDGKVIDVNQAFDGGGPFSLTRTGSLPVGGLIEMCFGGDYSKEQIRKMVTEEGGLMAYLGTSNVSEIEDRIEKGDKYAALIFEAMAYQISKEIGAMATVLDCNVDAILLMGHLFNSKRFTDLISARIERIAPLLIFPIVNDMDSLASNGLGILRDEVEILTYE